MNKTVNLNNYLLNVVIPLIFWEWWYVAIIFMAVVGIETAIINTFIKSSFRTLFKIIFYANLITTLVGYLVQGIGRLILTGILYSTTQVPDVFEDNPILRGVLANVGMSNQTIFDIPPEVWATITTGLLITFTLSVTIEQRIIKNKTNFEIDKGRLSKSVIIANIITYLILAFWLFYNYSRVFVPELKAP